MASEKDFIIGTDGQAAEPEKVEKAAKITRREALRNGLKFGAGAAVVAVGANVVVPATKAQQGDTFTYFFVGESLHMSTDGPWYNRCHHYVHFTYDSWMDGRIVSYSVQALDPFAFPSPWAEPSNGQLNAGYHLGILGCGEDTVHSPWDFWLWLTVRQ